MKTTLPIPSYVASLAPKDAADAERLLARVPGEASAIEYRLDLAETAIPPARLASLDPRPAILTWRTIREGGAFTGSPDEYRRRVEEAYAAGAVVDVEHASGLLGARGAFPDRGRVVVSHHSPFALPGDWESRLAAMRATGARGVKLVAGAADLAASLRIAGLQARQPHLTVSVFPMGPASPPGRVLSALAGGSLVYGPVEHETAAGQIALRDLFEIYRIQEPRAVDALYGIVGGSPAKSLSPFLYNALFRARAMSSSLYVPLPVSDFEREAPQGIDNAPPIRGMAVTQPWKLAAARAGRPSEDVVRTGAANTLSRERTLWRAENTDVDGVFDSLADHDTGEGREAVIVGAGGAARAAVVATRKLGYEVRVCARRDTEADRVAELLGVDSLAWEDLAASEADLYLNATPVGWADGDPSAIPERVLEGRPLIFDCVYRKDGKPTSTIRAARNARCPVVEGLTMLAAQAVRQAQLFGIPDVTLSEVTEILGRGVGR
ncbi:MAG TPA: type I 3-dehydroquinate dehydratase [Thermoanaerobaculia bacterium]